MSSVQVEETMRVKYGLTFASGLLECLCFAGAVFGWASLVFVLKTEGFFNSLCVNTTGVNATQPLGQCHALRAAQLPLWLWLHHIYLQPALQ